MAEDMLAQAVLAKPQECVGLIGGSQSLQVGGECVYRGEMLAPAHNRSPTPETHFWVEPHEQYRIEQALSRKGVAPIAAYHSHPQGREDLSEADLKVPGRLMVIVPLAKPPRLEHITAWFEGEPVQLQLT